MVMQSEHVIVIFKISRWGQSDILFDCIRYKMMLDYLLNFC